MYKFIVLAPVFALNMVYSSEYYKNSLPARIDDIAPSGIDKQTEFVSNPKSKFRNLTIEIPRNVFFPDGYIETPAMQPLLAQDRSLQHKSEEFCPPVPKCISKSQDNELGKPAEIGAEKQSSQKEISADSPETSDSSKDASSSESSGNLQEYEPIALPGTPRHDLQTEQPPPIKVPLIRKWIFKDCAVAVDSYRCVWIHRLPYQKWLNVHMPIEEQQFTVTPGLVIMFHSGMYWFHYKHYWVLMH